MDVKNVKVGLYNFIVIGLIAVLFIVAAKAVVGKFPIPGATEVINAV